MMGGRTVPWAVLTALLGGFLGCRTGVRPVGDPDPSQVRAGLEVVALLPILVESSARDLDTEEFARLLAAEWVRTAGVRVARPGGASGGPPAALEEALRLAREAKADALMAIRVTRYDPYAPPAIGLAAQFLRVEARPLPEDAVDRLVRSASWRLGPLLLERPRAGHWIASLERDYDTRDREVRERLKSYVRERDAGDSALDGEREFLAVQPRYLRFVAGEIVRDLLRAVNRDEP